VAALIVPGSDLIIENVGLNPTRAALFDVLRQMGGAIEELDRRDVGGEPVADLRVRASALTGIEVDPAVVPAMVDEFPVLFVAAAHARGRTVTRGLEELRVKESDRITVMRVALELAGANVTETEDGLIIEGTDGAPFPARPPMRAWRPTSTIASPWPWPWPALPAGRASKWTTPAPSPPASRCSRP
jgi:3-phosphoshikimate 1-carboxyvinyltransferase